jgi:transcriptional regulator with XRE-family HTH domain
MPGTGFTTFLRGFLEQRGMSQRDFAKAIGTTQSAISHYLADRAPPPLDQIDAWAKALEIPIGSAEHARFVDLAALAHLPAEARPRFERMLDRIEAIEATLAPLADRPGRPSSWWDRLLARVAKVIDAPFFKPLPNLPRATRIVGTIGGHGNWTDPQLERRVGMVYQYDGMEVQHGAGRQLIPDSTVVLVTPRTPIRGDVVALRLGGESDLAYFIEQRVDAITVMDLANLNRLVDIPLHDIERMCVVAGVPWKQTAARPER